jgi:acetyl esterase
MAVARIVEREGSPILPGRLGNPDLTLGDEPRADPRIVAALTASGLGGELPRPTVTASSTITEIRSFIALVEQGSKLQSATVVAGLPRVVGVISSEAKISGLDGNEVRLYVHRPNGQTGPLPGILHLHGGGMVMTEASGALYTRWREELAATGLVVIGVEFRNGAGVLGPYPFPAGLDDCAAALEWVSGHRQELNLSKVVISGDSGGGNLSLASALRAQRENRAGLIDGVYALCPFISNAYDQRSSELPSLYENDGFFISCSMVAVFARAYDPQGENATNPLAWPYHASDDELRGLPPHVISVNELDPFRDEGLAYFRKLLRAGVPAISRTANGTVHAAENNFLAELPDIRAATMADINHFANSL